MREPSQSDDHSTSSPSSTLPDIGQFAHAKSGPLRFDELAQGQPEVQIEYHGQVYRLRATRNGKLILNK